MMDTKNLHTKGLALLEQSRHQGERQRGQGGLTVRVGLHTGSVLLGGGVDAEDSIRGIAVSIAARMEQTAPPGNLRISNDTYRHVRGQFEVEAQQAIELKGLDEPFITYSADLQLRELQLSALAHHGVKPRRLHAAETANRNHRSRA